VRQKPSNRVERVTFKPGSPISWARRRGETTKQISAGGVGLAEMEGPREDDATADRRFDLLTRDQKTVGFPATHAAKRALIPS
jgi:hypothetical protein